MENIKKTTATEVVEKNGEGVKPKTEMQAAQACKKCEVKDKTILRLENEKLDASTTSKLMSEEQKRQIENLERIKRDLTEKDKTNSEKILAFETKEKDAIFTEKFTKAGGIPERKEYFKKIAGDTTTPEEWLKVVGDFPEFFKNEPKAQTTVSNNEFSNPNRQDNKDDSGTITGLNFVG